MTSDKTNEQQALEFQDRIASMTDKELREAFISASGEDGDQWTDLLADACETRNIDI